MTVITDPTSQGGTTPDPNIPVIGQQSPGGVNSQSAVIPVDSLGKSSTAPQPLPTPPAVSNLGPLFDSGNASIAGHTTALLPTTTGATSDASTANPSWYQKIIDAIKPTSGADMYANDSANAGIDQKTADLNAKNQAVLDANTKLTSLNTKLDALNKNAQAIPIQDQQNSVGKGITAGGLAPITAAQIRENALQAIPLQTQVMAAQADVAAAQGNAKLAQDILTTAQDHVDKLFQIHMSDATTQFNYQKSLVDMYYQYADKQQQAALDAKKTTDAQAFSTLQNTLNQAQSLANNAIASGQGDIAGKILALDPKSPTYAQDVGNLASQITPANKYQISNSTDAFGNPISRVFDSTTGKFISGGPTTDTTATNGVPIIGSGGMGTGTNASGQKLSFDQYGLLANTDFNPTNMVDQLSQKYLDQYIKNGTVPTASSLGRNMKPEAMAQVDNRARDLYFKATGNPLPSPQIIKGYQDLINSNNKLANNLSIQEQTVRQNVDLSIANMKANDLNSSSFQPLNNFINNVGTMFSDPHIGQLIAQNSTIQNELGSLLAVKNASGTTVYDKLASAGIINKNDPQSVITSKVNALMQEATNFAGSLANANADIYKQVDPFLQDPNNPARSALKVETALNSQGLNYNDIIGKTPNGQIPVMDKSGNIGYITPAEFNSQYYTKL